MKWLKWFKKSEEKRVKETNPYALMGSVGVSPEYLHSYEASIEKIKQFGSMNQPK